MPVLARGAHARSNAHENGSFEPTVCGKVRAEVVRSSDPPLLIEIAGPEGLHFEAKPIDT